ncbi:TetR/AcrR family transcriptional regulator [Streptomyces sp. NPDC088923]|uniref:TetR/AcrR family transcriptional regulator n=1 Tax=Streptomyces sp. NPDC088923 TaxID=3365913 RepID=UPI0037F824C7
MPEHHAHAREPAEEDGGGGLRARKKLRTRRELRRAATRLYAERGAAHVTVQDICAEVGISPRTFFNYFESKDDALFGLDHRLRERVVAGLLDRPAAEAPLPALREAILAAVPAVVGADTEFARRRALLHAEPELLDRPLRNNRRMEEAVTAALASRTGAAHGDLYPHLVAATALAAMRAALRGWEPHSGAEGLTAALEQAFGLLAAGLPVPPAEPAPVPAGRVGRPQVP